MSSTTAAGVVGAVAAVLGLQVIFMTCCGGGRSSRALPARHQRGLHLARRAQHALSGLCICAVHQICHDRIKQGEATWVTPHTGAAILAFFAAVFLVVHAARLRYPTLNDTLVRVMENVLREEEASGAKIPASFWFLLGSSGVMLLYPAHGGHLFRLPLLLLSLGDPAAGLLGSLYGRTPWRGASGKTVEGSLGCALVCAVVAVVYFLVESEFFGYEFFFKRGGSHSRVLMWQVSALVGLIGALSELVKVPHLDDNLTMPVFAACGLWLVHVYFIPWAQ